MAGDHPKLPQAVAIVRHQDHGQKVICSGVPLSPTLTLTAGHCLPTQGNSTADKPSTDFALMTTSREQSLRTAKRWLRHPQFLDKPERGREDFDLALIESEALYEQANTQPHATLTSNSFVQASANSKEQLWLLGFSPARLNLSLPQELMSSPRAWSAIQVERQLTNEGKVLARAQQSSTAAACPGDSGAPVWSVQNNQFKLIGLVVQANCTRGEVKFIDLQRYDDWILSTVQQLSGSSSNLWALWNNARTRLFSTSRKVVQGRE